MVKQQRENKSNNVVFVILGTLIVVVIVAGVLVGIAATLTSSTDVEETPRVYVDPDDLTVDKPIIYLYPERTTDVSVRLGNVDQITTSYPEYSDGGWLVTASPNGHLTDKQTGRHLYSLYYESQPDNDFAVQNDGFVVSRDDTINFLEDKLSQLGLNEREAEEFIIYWLPRLQQSNYNYIRFATIDEINRTMPLNIQPQPDTVIRVMMTYKPLDEPFDVTEQQLPNKPVRSGFTVVEWGGTEITD